MHARKLDMQITGCIARHSSSQRVVLSTEILFLLSDAHEGTSSGRVDHKFGFKAHIVSIYCTGFA